jgi:deoxyribose-phosphate aldolase
MLAGMIDSTLLAADATRQQIGQLCAAAQRHGFATVCVNGRWVEPCVRFLRGSPVKVTGVVGFPLGSATTTAKAAEAWELTGLGADELDMVAPLGALLDDEWDYAGDEIRAVIGASPGATVKVILETAALDPLRLAKAGLVAREAGAHFLKTSTGFHPAGGATAAAVALLRVVAGDTVGVKASGGIRDRAGALEMIAAGATRIGTSRGVDLLSET